MTLIRHAVLKQRNDHSSHSFGFFALLVDIQLKESGVKGALAKVEIHGRQWLVTCVRIFSEHGGFLSQGKPRKSAPQLQACLQPAGHKPKDAVYAYLWIDVGEVTEAFPVARPSA
ncbi:hypothetical protein [Rhizobium sp. RCAM05973]|uniref:hypothetical protein n=1 Tax=Rhizobium sp. RCAM05973 TaxID=2994066 RepID=UPI0022EBD93F|nr:hypothetical protein [Rhizobium sp. RCAM05973]